MAPLFKHPHAETLRLLTTTSGVPEERLIAARQLLLQFEATLDAADEDFVLTPGALLFTCGVNSYSHILWLCVCPRITEQGAILSRMVSANHAQIRDYTFELMSRMLDGNFRSETIVTNFRAMRWCARCAAPTRLWVTRLCVCCAS